MVFAFDEFELDTRLFELRRDGERCPLEPQVYDLLAYLVEHHDRVVTRDELIDRIWPERFISEAALTTRLMAARKALGDTGREQRYIRTLHGRGYRFVGSVTARESAAPPPAPAAAPAAGAPAAAPTPPPSPAATPAPAPSRAVSIFGREAEVAHLQSCLAEAARGERRVVFVTGEGGIGKTTLVNAFLQVAATAPLRVMSGQCIEHRGVGEAYRPVLDALGRLCRESGGERVVELLAHRAPTWLVQMPSLVSDDDLRRLQDRTLGNTRERMLRELVEAVEELAAEQPLVLLLEDLHWSDHATLDFIDWLARRREPARLLLLGTYRPSDVRATGHPLDALQHELRVRGLCQEIALPFLTEGAVEACLAWRFPGADRLTELAATLMKRTDGNPLFIENVLEAWQARGAIVRRDGAWHVDAPLSELERALPDTLRQLIEQHIAGLGDDDQQILEAAAVAGSPFAPSAIAGALGISEELAETRCAQLARAGHFLAPAGTVEWPDGTTVSRFAFVHNMHEEVLFGRTPPARRARLHQAIGLRLERAYGARAADHAVELARHFVGGRDDEKSLVYLQAAAEHAMQLGAHREASHHLSAVLDVLSRSDGDPLRTQLEASVQAKLASTMIVTRGFGSPEAQEAFTRALDLAVQLDDLSGKANVILSMTALLEYQSRHADAQALLEQLDLDLLARDPRLRLPYHALRSCASFHQGAFGDAVEHADKGLLIHTESDQRFAFLGDDAGVGCREWSSLALWFLGYPDLALERVRSLIRAAERPDRRYTLASALSHAARLRQLRLEPERAHEEALRTITIAAEHGFAYHAAVGTIVRGWALAALGFDDEGIAEITAGIEAHHLTGATMDRLYFLGLLADAHARNGRPGDGLAAVDDALATLRSLNTPFFYEAELHRLRGSILLQADDAGDTSAAEASLRTALEIARRQNARSIELRAATALGRLLLDRGGFAEARTLIEPLIDSFTEGFDTFDYRDARRLADDAATAPPAARRRPAARRPQS